MKKRSAIVCRYIGFVLLASMSLMHLIHPNQMPNSNFPAPVQDIIGKETNHATSANARPAIKTINLIGERHSGTKWITSHIEDCFQDQVKVLNRYTRYKHWFQYEDSQLYAPNSSIVVALFRDPYDWLESMRKKPYHSPNHFDLDWNTFLTRPWGMDRGPADLQLIMEGQTHNVTCMHRFPFENIIPCSKLDRNMYNGTQTSGKKIGVNYELNQDGSGSAYESILQLRSEKIRNFLDVQNYAAVHKVYAVQFEYMVTMGSSELIDELENVTGYTAKCQRSPPHALNRKNHNASFVQWVNDHLDWETEHLIGYHPR